MCQHDWGENLNYKIYAKIAKANGINIAWLIAKYEGDANWLSFEEFKKILLKIN